MRPLRSLFANPARRFLALKAAHRRSRARRARWEAAERIEVFECRTLLSATPTLTVADPSGTFTGSPFVATVSATVSNAPIPIAQSLNFSTYLGSTSTSRAINVATDNFGNTFVTGWTTGSNFPTTPAHTRRPALRTARSLPLWRSSVRAAT